MTFEELQSAIAGADTLAKSLAVAPEVLAKGGDGGSGSDDSRVAAAAADGAAAGGNADGGDPTASKEDDDETNSGDGAGNGDVGAGAETPITKSFTLTLDDGSTMEAVDASEMLKSLQVELDTEKASRAADTEQFLKSFGSTIGIINALTGKVAEQNELMTKALSAIEAQKGEIATLTKSLATVSNQGRGRASVLSVLERPAADGRGAEQPTLTRPEILAKTMSALGAGRITGTEATKVEAALNEGIAPRKEILDRILGQ